MSLWVSIPSCFERSIVDFCDDSVSLDTRECYDPTMKVRVTSRDRDDGCPEGIYDVTEENIVLFLLGLGSSGVLDF